MKVRTADPTDAAALLALRCALWPERDVHRLEQELRQRADSRARHETLLVENEAGVVCGFAELTRDPGQPGDSPRVMLNAVFVAPSARRRGAAARLMGEAERWARGRGASVLVCEMDAEGQQQLEALAWLGFATAQVRVRLHRPIRSPDDSARGVPQSTPLPAAAANDGTPPVLIIEPARRPWFTVFNVALAAAGAASFAFTDIYSPDVVRGAFLPLLDAAVAIYFIFLFLMLRYRKRADSSARAEQLFRKEP